MLPFLEVDHLPSSSSFYSAIIQPLGLRYLSTEDGHFPSISYGTSSRAPPLFQIRQVVASRDRPLRTSRIVLSAPSEAAADEAYEFALRANPDARDVRPRHFAEGYAAASGASAHRTATSGGGTRVVITDFDGNVMEIAYRPPPEYPPDYTGETYRKTRSTSQEVTRILDWNFDIAHAKFPAVSGPGSASSGSTRTASRRSYARHPEDDDDDQAAHPGVRRSVTTGSAVYEPATSARENSNGLSAGAVVGTLLGVAAAGVALGGAYTYMTKSDRSRAPRQEYDMPSFTRRSTYPEGYDGYPDRRDRKSRYVEVDRPVDPVRYQDDYLAVPHYRRPAPEYIARYSQVGSTPSRDADDPYDDSRGRHPSSRSRASSTRPRSESATNREPYAVGEVEHRSYVSSRSSRHPPIVRRSYTSYDTPDRDSYVSARSQRSNSTLRGPPPDSYAPAPHTSSRSRSGTRVTTTTIKSSGIPRTYSREGNYSRDGSYFSARHVPLPDSRAPTYISARDVPLPSSRAPTYLSSRDVPLPDSRAHTYVSARDVPLPDSRAPTYVSPHDIPLPESRAHTYISARHVPLPASRVGGRRSKWEDEADDYDDDADSLGPEDSISCVGSRRH